MNRILCFDTSSNSCSVAISEGQNVLFFQQALCPSMQAEQLMVMIEQALQSAKMHYSDLDYLAVTVGPGSFTGIRIGLAAAKGILYASNNIKGLGINNFAAAFYRLKMQVTQYDSAFIILNAYRNQMYVQEFMQNGSFLEPQLIDNPDLIELLKARKGRVVCAGSGVAALYSEVKDQHNLMILPRFPVIKAMHIARFADEQIKSGIFSPVEPLYIRPPDAIAAK